MRKIRSQGEIARKKRRDQIVVGIVLIFLLVVSTLGYSLMSGDVKDEDVVNELGFDFIRDGGYWKVVIGSKVFGFQYLPSEVADIFVGGFYDFEMYVNQPLYIVNVNDGVSDILVNFEDYILRYQEACLRQTEEGGGKREEEGKCEGDLPIKDCNSNLIIFEPGDESMVWQNESCVYIVGDSVRGADAFLYKVLKIS